MDGRRERDDGVAAGVTTPLANGDVHRELDYPVDGRQPIIGLEMRKDQPVLSLRLKGLRTGWYVDLHEFVEYATRFERGSEDRKLGLRPRKEIDEWLEERGLEKVPVEKEEVQRAADVSGARS